MKPSPDLINALGRGVVVEVDDSPQAAAARQATDAQARQVAELGRMVQAYHHASEQLRASHEALLDQVNRLQSQLASTDARLARSQRLAALGEMAAGIAHEVRNPLAAIQLYTGELVTTLEAVRVACPRESAEAIDVAQRIDGAVRGLDRLVGDVLSFARELRPIKRPIAAGEVLERSLDLVRPTFEQHGVTAAITGDRAKIVVADADLLQQALLNVLRNAAEAMAEAPGQRRVSIDLARDGQWATIAISDTGPGIDAELIARIFNPFVSTRDTGTGLGLAIVHRIADAHGGTIAAANDPAGGARFTLYLPHEPHGPHETQPQDESQPQDQN